MTRLPRRVSDSIALCAAFLFGVALAALLAPEAWGQERALPRFASVRADEANMRTGPDFRYPIDWVLTMRDQPVEIIDEYDMWRQVRDWQGDVGWVHRRMLSSTRTVIFTANAHLLRADPDDRARAVAEIARAVVGELVECRGRWCRVEVHAAGHDVGGWALTDALWGVVHTEASADLSVRE